ncbi:MULTISPECIES: YdcH family protein [unclassified Bartonella]|uniref:YdcH family protein n=1 Tax=unclassified Bartonella TaxID=2645622 RepID=UPI00352D7CBD
MTISAHLEALEKKHDALEAEIKTASNAPSVDDLVVADLKRKKLLIKDEIEALRSEA